MYKGYNSDTQPRQKVGINRIIHTFVDCGKKEREREKKYEERSSGRENYGTPHTLILIALSQAHFLWHFKAQNLQRTTLP